jgi:hypothetical protein
VYPGFDRPPAASVLVALIQERRSLTSRCSAGRNGNIDEYTLSADRPPVVRMGPGAARVTPAVSLEFERVEALELLGMVLAHLSIAETRSEPSPRAPGLMGIRDKLQGLTKR